ncbi:MAG: exodeoxyribonuclease VII large subunit [Candidatus Syntropharchaeia archaeon]
MDVKKTVTILSTTFFIAGLFLIYISSLLSSPRKVSIDEITNDYVGSFVKISGRITFVRNHRNGHVFLTVEENGRKIQVPIFSSLADQLREKGYMRMIKVGKNIIVSGFVGEYRGKLQVVPRKLEDIRIP